VTPQALWWALSPETAKRRGLSDSEMDALGLKELQDPSKGDPDHSVVLLDEIDKADPDLPNDLLVPLGGLEFEFTELESPRRIRAAATSLVIVTTNEERDLPLAFLRRCVVLLLEPPGRERMLAIARAHFPKMAVEQLDGVVNSFERLRDSQPAGAHEPGLAEYLDAVAAVAALEAEPNGGARWSHLAEFTWLKPAPDEE
jgi:MoxR-like ATPase